MKEHMRKTRLEKWLDCFSILGIVAMIVYILMYWTSLPHTIPTHFGLNGEADGFGEKGNMFIHPILGLGLYIFFNILSRFPNIFNYPANTTEETKPLLFVNSRKMLGWMNLQIILFSVYNTWENTQAAINGKTSMSMFPLIIFIVVLLGTMVFYIVKGMRIASATERKKTF
ncbi:DUF1648 domain-containing protein [Bacillus sp. DX4.1]|uniref:DUF1648 domain-containing protein n=1 Tax=Bacillus sp. DX4.1 TaxID=3055867 RepID=UPI0025A0CBA0|nr:DUF1648 domain-containing protein [Bacillus sp. DX4.1]MDM5187439.1 DUF1648 domain-containing protein [Bacillus sp. DX4.1]